jgi:hypothetical protein
MHVTFWPGNLQGRVTLRPGIDQKKILKWTLKIGFEAVDYIQLVH